MELGARELAADAGFRAEAATPVAGNELGEVGAFAVIGVPGAGHVLPAGDRPVPGVADETEAEAPLVDLGAGPGDEVTCGADRTPQVARRQVP